MYERVPTRIFSNFFRRFVRGNLSCVFDVLCLSKNKLKNCMQLDEKGLRVDALFSARRCDHRLNTPLHHHIKMENVLAVFCFVALCHIVGVCLVLFLPYNINGLYKD